MVHEDVEDAITKTLNNIPDLDILFIPSYDDGPEPTDPYGVVNVSTYRKQHRDTNNFYKTDTGFEESVQQDFEVLVNISVYGTGAYDNAFKAATWLSYREVKQELSYFKCISLVDIMEIQRVPEIRDTGTIQKALFNLNLLIGYENSREIDWFDTVEYGGDYVDAGNQVVYSEADTVSANDPPPTTP